VTSPEQRAGAGFKSGWARPLEVRARTPQA